MAAPSSGWAITALDVKRHARESFSCSDAPELERYLKQQAVQDIKRNVARVFVAPAPGDGVIAGFYSLNAASFQKESLPAKDAKRLPAYPVPAALIGRLAVHDGFRKQGLGEYLLMSALDRIHNASQSLAIHAIVVDARDEAAVIFYKKYGFLSFSDLRRRLFLPMETVHQLLAHDAV